MIAQIRLQRLKSSHERQYLKSVRSSLDSIKPWIEVAHTKKSFAKFVREVSGPDGKAYLVKRVHDEALVGVIEIRDIFMGTFKCGYLIYYAFDEFKGQGYMKEALRAVIRKVFTKLKLHRLEANIQPQNTASVALAKSAGLLFEGYSPKFLKINGQWRDHERWAIINEDLN
jgi:ribosomal-protein-alanine N-acetyltransferase